MKKRWLGLGCGLALALGVQGASWAAGEKIAPASQLVVLDTDIGDDIDDAFALGLLLKSPEVRLLGVTTTCGQTRLRARLAERYLRAVGRADIPVAAGVEGAACGYFSQEAYARRWPERRYADGVQLLLDQIRAHPGQVTVVAIGALTNLRAAFERDPEGFRQLKRVVLMGGSVYEGYEQRGQRRQPPSIEWNIRCDPAAARAVLNAGVLVYVLPLDATQVHLRPEELRRLLGAGSPVDDQIALLYAEWTGESEWKTPTLFDSVAAAFALQPELCPMQPMRLEVDGQGWTRPVAGKPNVSVCLKVDEAELRSYLLKRLRAPEK